MKKTLFILSIFVSLAGFGQTMIGNQLVDSFPINAYASMRYKGLVSLPASYATSNKTYPLLIHLHGDGEKGSTVADLQKLCTTSWPQKIASGFKPWAKGQEFIVISPQSPTSPGNNEGLLKWMLADMIKRYRIDTTRMGIEGYSYGGYDLLTCAADDVNFLKRFAWLIPVASAQVEPNRETVIPINIAAAKTPVWFICGAADGMIKYSDAYAASINAVTKGPQAIETRLAGVGHSAGAWNLPPDTSWRPNGLNTLEWALQYSTGTAAVISTPPPVVVTPKVDSAGIIKAYLVTHPCPTVDSVGIGKAYAAAHPCPVCPPPVVCPVCPAPRTVIKMVNDIAAGICYLIYSDGYTQQISK